MNACKIDADELSRAADAVQGVFGSVDPFCAMILGSGWSTAVESLPVRTSLPYADVPVMGRTGVRGHSGHLALLEHDGGEILAFLGRRHWYEGEGWNPIAFPVYLARRLGAQILVLTNAAGAIRPDLEPGSLMVIEDHINAMGVNPLVGPHNDCWGPRFPDQSKVYDAALRTLLIECGERLGLSIHIGTYVASSGPSYETPAEVNAFRTSGGDAVGMSTVPEALLANSAGLRVAAVSCITNFAAGRSTVPLSHEEVLQTTAAALPGMQSLISSFLHALSSSQ